MAHQNDPKQQLNAAGIDAPLHARCLALHAAASAAGLDWLKILEAIRQYGPIALDVLEKILGG